MRYPIESCLQPESKYSTLLYRGCVSPNQYVERPQFAIWVWPRSLQFRIWRGMTRVLQLLSYSSCRTFPPFFMIASWSPQETEYARSMIHSTWVRNVKPTVSYHAYLKALSQTVSFLREMVTVLLVCIRPHLPLCLKTRCSVSTIPRRRYEAEGITAPCLDVQRKSSETDWLFRDG